MDKSHLSKQHKCETLQGKPKQLKTSIVGYMSVDGLREYHSDLSQLKFINHIPTNRLSWDLNHNINQAVKRTTGDSNEKIDLLLKFLVDQGHRLHLPDSTFITYRRTLINVMYSAYNLPEDIFIRASLYRNNIYLCDIESELSKQRPRSEQEKNFCAWGYKFEQYITSDLPTLTPNINLPVIENEEFSLYYSTQIGDHNLFYGAQLDGLLATSGTVPNPPNSSDVQEIVDYLNQHQYIELKTNKEIQNFKHERTFKRYKLLRCWCQCYLADLKGLLVGFRNDHGIVRQLKWFDTPGIAEYCKHEWEPQTALDFLNYFLSFVKNSFNMYKEHADFNKPLTLEFCIDRNRTINVTKVHKKEKMILPDWYLMNK